MALSKSGYIKAVAVHMKTSLGRPMENAEEIVRQVKQYEAKNPDLIVFGELSISGYSCGDLFFAVLYGGTVQDGNHVSV